MGNNVSIKVFRFHPKYWLAPGSNRYVWKKGNFQTKASTEYDNALVAISYETSNQEYSAKQKWREIYGTRFPS